MPSLIVESLKTQAFARGFSLFGIAPATDADGFGRFCDWLAAGYAGEMNYLHEQGPQRRHPRSVVESVRSVVMLGLEYKPSLLAGRASDGQTLAPSLARPANKASVAAYAAGPDYHRYIWNRLTELSEWLMAEAPGSYAHGVTDTAPILERDFARRAGLGWFGKNTMLINKDRGSFFFLASLLTSLELPPSEPYATNHCGTCTACLDACPTEAFVEPGKLDARKCISYLTIELRTAIPEPLRPGVGDWIFGCDVCQDVCPWNRFAGQGVGFPHRPELASLDPVEILGLSDAEYRKRFKGTSIFRAQWSGLRRNAAIVLGNTGGELAIPALEAAMHDADEMVSEAAAWALERVRQRISRV
jgi:epoxyqueuosine reductase